MVAYGSLFGHTPAILTCRANDASNMVEVIQESYCRIRIVPLIDH